MPMLKHNNVEVVRARAYAWIGKNIMIPAIFTCYDDRKVFPTYFQYTLRYSTGTSHITSYSVRRTSSPRAEAFTGDLTSGEAIYTGDVLEVSATANSGYYMANSPTRDTASYTESITVSGDITIVFKAVVKNTLYINTTSAGFAAETGKYIWGQTFSGLSNAVTDRNSAYYPYVDNSLVNINGSASSASATSISFSGWVSSPNQAVRAYAYYYSETAAVGPTVYPPDVDDLVYMPFEVTLVNTNNFTVQLQVRGYWESSTGLHQINSWTTIDTLIAGGSGTIYPSDMVSGVDDEAEIYTMELEFRFAYSYYGVNYYSEEVPIDL